jgi:hypothetical protein
VSARGRSGPAGGALAGVLRAILLSLLVASGVVAGQAHQVTLSTARVELLAHRMVRVEVALQGSDADRIAGTSVFNAQTGLVDPSKLAGSTAPIAAYVGAHVGITGARVACSGAGAGLDRPAGA